MNWEALYVAGVLAVVAVALAKDWVRPDAALLAALGAVVIPGLVAPEDAFLGFANPAVIALASLFIVAAGFEGSSAAAWLERLVLPARGGMSATMARLMGSTAFLSSVLNNTPIVAMLLPSVRRWGVRHGVPASRLLIPLSYGAIIGGMTTLIGTSTNIVVATLSGQFGGPTLHLFDFAWVGVPVALVVTGFFVLGGWRLLPDRGTESSDDGLTDCVFELRVSGAPIVGRTVQEAALRDLGSAFLAHIQRDGHIVPARPSERLEAGDLLVFTGPLTMLEEMLRRPGLSRPHEAPSAETSLLPLYEAVVSETSVLAGRSLRDVEFRERYRGVVLAIQRSDERLGSSLGKLRLRPGDLLIIEAEPGFERVHNTSRADFYLVAPKGDRMPQPPSGSIWPTTILVSMVLAIALDWLPLATATFAAALATVISGSLRLSRAREAVDLSVLVIIAAALGVGKAVETSGLALIAADALVEFGGSLGTMGVLATIFVGTNVLTELMTHKASAVLMVPVALRMAEAAGLNPEAAVLVVAAGAAASFMTPIGYQTNTMVMAAGRYRFADFLRVGVPVSLLVMLTTVLVLAWRFG